MKFYDKEGNLISAEQWRDYIADLDYKRVAFWENQHAVVSTVWLGLDHNYEPNATEPHVFETMVFTKDKDGMTKYLEIDMARCGTLERALQQHEELRMRELKRQQDIKDHLGAL